MNSTTATDFFTALIRGGTNNVTGKAQLDGVVLAGWRTGASVHVEFDRIRIPGPGCVGAPAGKTCFVGTIQLARPTRLSSRAQSVGSTGVVLTAPVRSVATSSRDIIPSTTATASSRRR